MKLFPIEYLYLYLIHPHFELDYPYFFSNKYEEVNVCDGFSYSHSVFYSWGLFVINSVTVSFPQSREIDSKHSPLHNACQVLQGSFLEGIAK